jgi:hypothetical protein
VLPLHTDCFQPVGGVSPEPNLELRIAFFCAGFTGHDGRLSLQSENVWASVEGANAVSNSAASSIGSIVDYG